MSGNLFKNKCEKIRSDLAVYVQQSIINEIKETYPDIELIPIGSVGKRKDNDFNGDIDIAIKCKDVNELEKIISNTFYYLDSIKTESLYIISIAYPYQYNDNEVKYVQCDFMNVWDKDYTEFRYYCPNYKNDESQYKVGQKIMFANMIINHTEDRHKGLPKGQYGKFDFRPTALYRYVYDIEKSLYKEEYVTISVDEIVNMCFSDGNINHFNSVETLWEAIHSDIFKYPHEVKSIEKNFFVNCWRKGWVNIVPENFNLQYWTNEELWYFMNKQDKINKINHSIAKIVDMENK